MSPNNFQCVIDQGDLHFFIKLLRFCFVFVLNNYIGDEFRYKYCLSNSPYNSILYRMVQVTFCQFFIVIFKNRLRPPVSLTFELFHKFGFIFLTVCEIVLFFVKNRMHRLRKSLCIVVRTFFHLLRILNRTCCKYCFCLVKNKARNREIILAKLKNQAA